MAIRRTQSPIKITIDKDRKVKLDELVTNWSMDQKKFMLQALTEYSPSAVKPTKTGLQNVKDFFFGKDEEPEEADHEEKTSDLFNTEIFSSPKLRYMMTGERNPRKAFHKIFDKEINSSDKSYLMYVLQQETDDVYVPQELIAEFKAGHKRHHQNLLLEEGAPSAPFYLFLGPTGSGKTKTVNRAIEKALFENGLELKHKVDEKLEDILKKHPIMGRLDLKSVAPESAERLEEEKRKKRLKLYSRLPVLKNFYKEETAEFMDEDDEQFGIAVDFDQINPNNVQTMWYGETGNKMKESFGPESSTSIRVLEEAHALLRVHQSHGAQVQEDTLVSTFNIIMDEVQNGKRNCMIVALTRLGEEFHKDIYRRFQEKGKIIDMSDYWKNPETIEKLVDIESTQKGLNILEDGLKREVAENVLDVFKDRDLDVTPAYVRKLLGTIIEYKGELTPDSLKDGTLVREAFVNVARNLYSDMFKKVYNRLDRDVPWEDYVGDVKEEFQRIANNRLIHDISAEKGVVLAGPPGTGKTYLARAYLTRNKDISDVTLKMEDLQDERDPIDGPVRKLSQAFDIAKMCGPTLFFVDEGESIAMERQGNIADRITNKLLNEVDGEKPLKGVLVTMTTNNPKYLAQAATRSKRLKVMPITGKFNEQNVYALMKNYIGDELLSPQVTKKNIYAVARQICSTPADYSAFFEMIVHSKTEDVKILDTVSKLEGEKLDYFIETNYKALLYVVDSLDFSETFINEARKDLKFLVKNKDDLVSKIKDAAGKVKYPITQAHVERAKQDRIQAPQLKGKMDLDDYLESQLSSEPQVGFVVGAGASETTGLLVPISSSLIYDQDNRDDKIIVTGAVNVNAPQAAELNASVEMMKHSSKEALTLVMNYLSSLMPDRDVRKIVGSLLKDTSLHHQFLTAQYMGGGPSAGMALAINTLSVILDLPVRNDFGITGAPWSRGKTSKEIGSAVLIGGSHNKSQVVLNYLDRMYVPSINIKDLDLLTLESHWRNGKDIVGYGSLPSIVGEIYSLELNETEQDALFYNRVEAKRRQLAGEDGHEELFKECNDISALVRKNAEDAIIARVGAIEKYLKDDDKDPFLSFSEIFRKYKPLDD